MPLILQVELFMRAFDFLKNLLISSLAVGSVSAFSSSCDDFVADSAFDWVQGTEFDLSRRPPNVFGRPLASLVMSPIQSLPKGMSSKEAAFFNGIFHTLRDLSKVYHLLHEVEQELAMIESAYSNAAAAYDQLLTRYELAEQITLETVDHPLLAKELREILARGSIFIDQHEHFLKAHLNPGLPALDGRWQHKKWVHRLQLHLILRDFKKHPESYGSPRSFKEMYRLLGSEELHRRLDWSDTNSTATDLFVPLFDSMENNGSSPGFYFEYRKYWPTIPQI